MNFSLITRGEADADIAESRDWYAGQGEGLAQSFLTALDDVFSRIRETPRLYAAGYRGIRLAGLRRFPYFVHYRILGDRLEVIAVLRGNRDPRIGRSRL